VRCILGTLAFEHAGVAKKRFQFMDETVHVIAARRSAFCASSAPNLFLTVTPLAPGEYDAVAGGPDWKITVGVDAGGGLSFDPRSEAAFASKRWQENHMAKAKTSRAVYRVTEIIGTSTTSWEDAAKNAVETAAESLRDLRVAEIGKLDMKVENGKVVAYRARVSLSFKYQG
jgi:hypothetical protein